MTGSLHFRFYCNKLYSCLTSTLAFSWKTCFYFIAKLTNLYPLAEITVGFENSSYTFPEGSSNTNVTVVVTTNVEQDPEFFNPPLDSFILVLSSDGTAESKIFSIAISLEPTTLQII